MSMNQEKSNRHSKLSGRAKDRIFSYTYLAPFLVIFILFTIVPVAISIGFSFTYYNVLEPPKVVFLQILPEAVFVG